jgi:hypothetical protein
MVERYADDLRAAGAKAYFFNGGTTTPLTVFQNSGESSAHTHPVVADSNGRWPDVFVPYITSYDVQVKTADDVQITYSLQIPNPDPVDLTVTIPAENQVATGMVHAEFISVPKAGYVRLNGRTIGNAASGATERANADTVNLFTYLWDNLSNTLAPVSGGHGASAAADFAANKTITLLDMRGASLVGVDDMGNSAALRWGSIVFNAGGSSIFTGSTTSTANNANYAATVATGGTSSPQLGYAGLVTWFIKL